MTDSERLDWLEWFVNEQGPLLLHDGNAKPTGYPGLGLRPGLTVRTMREAIDQCASPAAQSGAEEGK